MVCSASAYSVFEKIGIWIRAGLCGCGLCAFLRICVSDIRMISMRFHADMRYYKHMHKYCPNPHSVFGSYKDSIIAYVQFSIYSDVHINKHNAFFQGESIRICAYKCAYIIWNGYALMEKSAWPALIWIPISINYRWFGGSIASLVFATLVFGCWRIVKAAILQSTVSTRRCNSIMDQCKF